MASQEDRQTDEQTDREKKRQIDRWIDILPCVPSDIDLYERKKGAKKPDSIEEIRRGMEVRK